ncbi:hypothetical protein GCM10029963_24970 [Micromonospora andamanensis]
MHVGGTSHLSRPRLAVDDVGDPHRCVTRFHAPLTHASSPTPLGLTLAGECGKDVLAPPAFPVEIVVRERT